MLQLLPRVLLYVASISAIALIGSLLSGAHAITLPAAVVAALCLPIGLGSVPALRGFRFTAWIIAAVVVAMVYPGAFQQWGGLKLTNKVLLLVVIQAVMFGMGTQMKLRDFVGVLKAPKGVIIGLASQFTVMPFVGYGLTKAFSFPDEIAAGIVLIGCCSSGLASNVMTYLAGGNLALSVTVTAITTIIAPVMTPALMKLLAGALVEIRFVDMMLDIVKMVLVPIGAALLHDFLNSARASVSRRIHLVAAAAAVVLVTLPFGLWTWVADHVPAGALTWVTLAGFVLGAIVTGVIYHRVTKAFPKIASWMPVASMAGIVYFTTVTTAVGRNNLLQVGGLLFVAAAIHNACGYFFGYWISRATGLDKQSARAVAFEVGLQNGGMASGLAGNMGKLATMGLAAAIFSPWMNISGSILANIWRRMPIEPPDGKSREHSPEVTTVSQAGR